MIDPFADIAPCLSGTLNDGPDRRGRKLSFGTTSIYLRTPDLTGLPMGVLDDYEHCDIPLNISASLNRLCVWKEIVKLDQTIDHVREFPRISRLYFWRHALAWKNVPRSSCHALSIAHSPQVQSFWF
jgi:hypothetical protein